MKVLIFGGSGKIGSAVAYDLAKDPEVSQIGLVGRHRNTLDAVRKKIGSRKLVAHVLDTDRRKDVVALMKKYDVGVSVLPDRKTSYQVLQCSIEAGLIAWTPSRSSTDARPLRDRGSGAAQGSEAYRARRVAHKRAVESGVTFVDGVGFAPGLSNLTCGEAIRKLDKADRVIARVGGIPSKAAAARHPLRYMITWAFWHVLREYMIRLNVIQNGGWSRWMPARASRIPLQQVRPERDAGLRDNAGHAELHVHAALPQGVRGEDGALARPLAGRPDLKECGLLDIKPVDFKGRKIVPASSSLRSSPPGCCPARVRPTCA